jgi:hypothetical protein
MTEDSSVKKELMPVLSSRDERRQFPDIPDSVPMEWLSNDHAVSNHSQSLSRLKERGGLSVQEIWCNVTGFNIAAITYKMAPDVKTCIKFLNDKLNHHDQEMREEWDESPAPTVETGGWMNLDKFIVWLDATISFYEHGIQDEYGQGCSKVIKMVKEQFLKYQNKQQ